MSSEPNSAPRNRLLERIISLHRTAAAVVFNTLLLVVIVNLVLFFPYDWHDQKGSRNNPLLAHPTDWLSAAYPGWSPEERTELLKEIWYRFMVYDDYTMFKEGPVQGRYLNVTEAGFRVSKNQGPWPPASNNFNVFVFGGSTMFGSGLPDDQTVSSCLQDALERQATKKVCVYNFGRGFYYSTQERILLERLLSKGCAPDAAVFVDGLNDFIQANDTPAFQQRFKDAFELAHTKQRLISTLIQDLPLARLARSIQLRVIKPPPPDIPAQTAQAAAAISAYRGNKLLIESVCRSKGVTPIFIWQPIPDYKYNLNHFPWYAGTDGPRTHVCHTLGYPQMRALFDEGALGDDFIWCADLQQDEQECVYVDVHHYTAKFSRKLAEAICQMSLQRGVLRPGAAQLQQRTLLP